MGYNGSALLHGQFRLTLVAKYRQRRKNHKALNQWHRVKKNCVT